jgi:hypothetical protein
MTIEIIDAQPIDDGALWACWLEISGGGEAYLLPATAPGGLGRGDLLAHFGADEAGLFATARAKNINPDDIYNRLDRHILRAFALVVLDEINIIRDRAGLSPRTAAQLRQAVKSKLIS